jgi:hypothetical protein
VTLSFFIMMCWNAQRLKEFLKNNYSQLTSCQVYTTTSRAPWCVNVHVRVLWFEMLHILLSPIAKSEQCSSKYTSTQKFIICSNKLITKIDPSWWFLLIIYFSVFLSFLIHWFMLICGLCFFIQKLIWP